MSILVNKNTKVITQGITGKTGQFHTRGCRDYALGRQCFVAGVNPKKAGEDFEGIPIFASVREAKRQTGVNASVIYVPPPGAAEAIWEAVEAELDLVICITEGIPVRDMIVVRDRMRKANSRTVLLGPNCPGLITPDEIVHRLAEMVEAVAVPLIADADTGYGNALTAQRAAVRAGSPQ